MKGTNFQFSSNDWGRSRQFGLIIAVACCLILALNSDNLINGAPQAESYDALADTNLTSTYDSDNVELDSSNSSAYSDSVEPPTEPTDTEAQTEATPTSDPDSIDSNGDPNSSSSSEQDLANATDTTSMGFEFSDPMMQKWSEWIDSRMRQFMEFETKRRRGSHGGQRGKSTRPPKRRQEESGGGNNDYSSCGRNRAHEMTSDDEKEQMGRIVGGVPTMFGQYPYIISMRVRMEGGISTHICGASLLNERWAITAAHCVVSEKKRKKASDLVLRLGDYDLSNDNEPYRHEDRRVSKLIVYPKYDPSKMDYDVAMMKFDRPIKFKKHISPVCLPPRGTRSTYVGQTAFLSGWGDTWFKGRSPAVLQHTTLPIVSNAQCSRMTDNRNFPITQLCAGYTTKAQDSCQGDSGGPLVVSKDGRATLVGVVSYGFRCGVSGPKPGLYARVTEFLPWIGGVMARN